MQSSYDTTGNNGHAHPKQIYKEYENEKKRQYAERVMEIEQGTFTPLVFTTTGGMADECVKYQTDLRS